MRFRFQVCGEVGRGSEMVKLNYVIYDWPPKNVQLCYFALVIVCQSVSSIFLML